MNSNPSIVLPPSGAVIPERASSDLRAFRGVEASAAGCLPASAQPILPSFSVPQPIDPKIMIERARALLTDSEAMGEEKLRKIYEIIFWFAGKTSLTPPFCSLCLSPGRLANSHIIPNNILSSLGTPFITAQMPNASRSAANLTWRLFCTPTCEIKRLSECGENGFSLIFHQFMEDVIVARSKGTSATLTTSNQSVHYCIASIIFRYLIVSGKADLLPFINEHGPQVEEAFWRFFFLLRNYIMNKDHPQRPHIEMYINEEELQKPTMVTTICTTYPKPVGCYTTGHFSFKGFHFFIVESSEFMRIHASSPYFVFPPQGFAQTITFEPQVIHVKPEHVLILPYIVRRALKQDSAVFQTIVSKINSVFLASQVPSSTDSSLRRVAVPRHPLASSVNHSLMTRLPDDIHFHKNENGSGQLIFSNPAKYEIVFTGVRFPHQIWLVLNKPAKQIFIVINCFSPTFNLVFGFSFKQGVAISDLEEIADNGEELKKFLALTPLSKTDHFCIESITEDHSLYLLIASSLIQFLQRK